MLDRPFAPDSRRGGYTLIELLIVIGLLGLAGALLVPHLIDQPNLAVQAAVRQLIADLSFAQSDALAHQEFRRVHFYDDGRGYCLLRVNESNYAVAFDPGTAEYLHDPLAAAGELGRYIVDFTADDRFEGISISAVDIDSGGRDLVYDELGGTIRVGGNPGLGGTVDLAADGHTFRITISPFTGKLSVQEVAP